MPSIVIFLVSPRVALVLRSNALPLFDAEAPKEEAVCYQFPKRNLHLDS